MHKRRYKVALIGFDEPPTPRRRRRLPGAAAARRWWAWSWRLRLASCAFVLGIVILVMHVGS